MGFFASNMQKTEFGSDYHTIDCEQVDPNIQIWSSGNFYANGRQALIDLILSQSWSRLWIPHYFCYEIINEVKQVTGIDIKFYRDDPLSIHDSEIIIDLPYRQGDVLLRMNYFGMRSFRDNAKLSIPVIEDHSHDLIGDWAINSNAEWCIASLRKSIPLSQGGVLWSPVDLSLPKKPIQTMENKDLSHCRWHAMMMKEQYLNQGGNKQKFLDIYRETEDQFVHLPLSALNDMDMKILNHFNVEKWYQLKKSNWVRLYEALNKKIEILTPEYDAAYPFSFVVKGQYIKQNLIEKCVYPAVLWPMPSAFGLDLLSIHCDARYTCNDIDELIERINLCLN